MQISGDATGEDTENLSYNAKQTCRRYNYIKTYGYVCYFLNLLSSNIVALQASNAGFMVDCLKKPLLSPPSLNRSRDAYEEMKKQQMEEGDYLLVCPVKAGQHWTWEIMSMLIAGKAEYINSTKEFSWLDATPLDEIQKRYPKPRVLCTHVSLGWMPDSFR